MQKYKRHCVYNLSFRDKIIKITIPH